MRKINLINVNLPYIKQKIFIGQNIMNFAAEKINLQKYDNLLAVIDKKFYKANKKILKRFFKNIKIAKIIFLKPIIQHKDFNHCQKIIDGLIKIRAGRKSCAIALGGGYVSDIVGFVSATYMRGIDFIQISSTMMSMCDAVIGKVAINYRGIKNLLGAFYSPRFVFCDSNFLNTLKSAEIIYGLVEVWKHSLINNRQKSNAINKYLSANKFSYKFFEDLILFSLEVKTKYVVNDYNDKRNLHKALSLGHSLANYLEKKYKLRHGPAVLFGILFASFFSYRQNLISSSNFNDILQTIFLFEKNIGIFNNKRINVKDILNEIRLSKINVGQGYTFVLLTNSGYCVKIIDQESLRNVLEEFKVWDYKSFLRLKPFENKP